MKRPIKSITPPIIFNNIRRLKDIIKNKRKNIHIDNSYGNSLKGIHSQKRCFIIGSGSSIRDQDLTLLKDEIVMGINGVFLHPDIDKIKPEYFVMAPRYLHHQTESSFEECIRYLKNADDKLSDDTVMVLHVSEQPYIEKYNIYKNKNIIWYDSLTWFPHHKINSIELLSMPRIQYSTSETAIQIALYLECKDIYLLGLDHTWFDYQYFVSVEEYNTGCGAKGDVNSIKQNCMDLVSSTDHMYGHYMMFKKYEKLYQMRKNIYNANSNPNTYVDVFPKVKYEDVLANKL